MEEKKKKVYDLLIAGGIVIDPASSLKMKKDVAIKDGKISRMDDFISPDLATKTVDVSGLLVVPGLIDMHCHFYPKFPVATDGLYCVNPDAHFFQEGVTTAVDTGSCGTRDFIYFKERVLDVAKTRLLALINIADGGMVNQEREQDPVYFTPEIAAAMATSYPEQIIGIKTAHYWVGKPFDADHPPWASVDAALLAGELSGRRVMVDMQPTGEERTYQDLLLKKLRPGDIHTHMYAQQFPVLDENGKVNDFLWEAKQRGVLFDLGHGSGSFWFRNAVPSFEQGYWPDTLSTDLHFDNISGPVFGLTHVLSKYLSMGMDLMDVIKLATVAPAAVIGDESLGRIVEGGPADIAILRERTGDFGFPDCGGAKLKGTKRIECLMTLRNGEVVFDPDARIMPEWREAPEPYWKPPGLLK